MALCLFAPMKGQTLGVNPQTLSAVLHLWDPCNGVLQVSWLSYQFLLSGRECSCLKDWSNSNLDVNTSTQNP